MEKYNIEKRPLSNLLGLGELTITRYLNGQLPSKRYSDMLLRLLRYDSEMRMVLEKGKDNITDNAYRKAEKAVMESERLRSHDTKIEAVALYMIQSCYEITNMSLQKLLYYFKAFGYIFFGKEVIQAEIAEIDYENLLSNEERMVCDYVLQCFGIYNGGVLRELTHCEMPWKLAREGLGDMQPCANVISNENIFVTIQ